MKPNTPNPTTTYMNKCALVRELAVTERLTITTAYKAIDGLLRIMTRELARGGGVALSEFGLLYAKHQRSRTVIDAATGKALLQPPRCTASFHPYAELHAALNPRATTPPGFAGKWLHSLRPYSRLICHRLYLPRCPS